MALKKHLTQFQLCRYIIKKFVKSKNIAWGYEINQAKKLIIFEKNPLFWFKIKSKNLKSLDWLLSFEGKQFLINQKITLIGVKNQKKIYNLEQNKIGEDKAIDNKKISLIDFIKN